MTEVYATYPRATDAAPAVPFTAPVFVVPTRTDGTQWYSVPVELPDGTWVFELQWTETPGEWWLTLRALDGTPLNAGIRLVVDFPLNFETRLGPPGTLVLVDTSGARTPPGLLELGPAARCQLLYLPEAA